MSAQVSGVLGAGKLVGKGDPSVKVLELKTNNVLAMFAKGKNQCDEFLGKGLKLKVH